MQLRNMSTRHRTSHRGESAQKHDTVWFNNALGSCLTLLTLSLRAEGHLKYIYTTYTAKKCPFLKGALIQNIANPIKGFMVQ